MKKSGTINRTAGKDDLCDGFLSVESLTLTRMHPEDVFRKCNGD
jgi:hypothetical protein